MKIKGSAVQMALDLFQNCDVYATPNVTKYQVAIPNDQVMRCLHQAWRVLHQVACVLHRSRQN